MAQEISREEEKKTGKRKIEKIKHFNNGGKFVILMFYILQLRLLAELRDTLRSVRIWGKH